MYIANKMEVKKYNFDDWNYGLASSPSVKDIINENWLIKKISDVINWKVDPYQQNYWPEAYKNWFHSKYMLGNLTVTDLTKLKWWNSHKKLLKIDIDWKSYALKQLKTIGEMIADWHELPHRAFQEYQGMHILNDYKKPVAMPLFCLFDKNKWLEFIAYEWIEDFKSLSSAPQRFFEWREQVEQQMKYVKSQLKTVEQDLEQQWLYLWDITSGNVLFEWFDENWLKYRLIDCLLLNEKPKTKIVAIADV